VETSTQGYQNIQKGIIKQYTKKKTKKNMTKKPSR
jgi:hypothetical protein